jgi:peptide deformylase
VGLAANQIGVGLSVFVYEVDDESGVVVNPTVVDVSGELLVEDEGCLSVVGQVFDTPRHEFAVVTGFDPDGNPVEVRGEGLMARCLQHETDHLKGLLYLDHLSGRDRRAAIKEAAAREARPPTPGAFGAG